MGRKRKWANDAVKQQAYKIRCQHPDWSDERISKEILIGLDTTPTELKKQTLNYTAMQKSTDIPHGNDSATTKADEPLPPHLTVDLVEQYLIRLTREDPSAQVAAQLISWLDKRKELKKAEDQLSTIDLAGLMTDGNGTPA